jgi:hypothetical protein
VSTKPKATPEDRRVRELIARSRRPGFRELIAIFRAVVDLEVMVEAFREAHPPGHQCPACEHIREFDRVNFPAGPSDALVALHVAAWEFHNLLEEACR